MSRSDYFGHFFDDNVSVQAFVVVSETGPDRKLWTVRKVLVDMTSNPLLTFLALAPSAWKCGASTSCANSRRPFSVARAILVIGVSRLTKRVRCFPVAAASLQTA